MGGENLNPLDELKSLDQQVDQVTDLAGLKPIFFRLDEIAKANPDDFEVQLVVGDIKQHLVNRGTRLKGQMSDPAASAAAKVPSSAPPPVPPPIPTSGSITDPTPTPTRSPLMASGVGGSLATGSPLAIPPVPDAPTVKLTPRPTMPPQPVSQPIAGPPALPTPSKPITPNPAGPPLISSTATPGPPPIPRVEPAPAPRAEPSLFSEAPKPPIENRAPLSELKSPAPLMSSGQFSEPAKPPAPPQPIPSPISTAPTPIHTGPTEIPIENPAIQKGPPPMPAPGSIPAPTPAGAPPVPRPAPVIPSPQAPNPQVSGLVAAAPPVPRPAPVIPNPQAPNPQAIKPQPTESPAQPPQFPPGGSPIATGPQTPLFASEPQPAASHFGPALVAAAGAVGQAPPKMPPSGPAQPPVGSGTPAPPVNWKRPMLIGGVLGAVIAIGLLAFLIDQARKRNHLHDQEKAAGEVVQVQVVSAPANASIRVNGENKCNAPCAVALKPGSYQLMAFLDGYDPATTEVNVVAGQPSPAINLTLAAQPQTVRILTDLDSGKIAFDDQPPVELQEGQFILEKVAPGSHTVKVTGKAGDATFTFDVGEAKPPEVTGTVNAHNLIAVLVSSFGSRARVVTSSGPMKMTVNGQDEGDAGPVGVDLKAFQPGVDELVVGQGKDQRNMKESFGPAPMLTAFLKSDLNIGTLIVSTGEDGVKVFVNDKEYRRPTQRGQVRIPAIGKVTVRVAKDGFQTEPAQTAELKKGAEVRLEFKMRAMPVVSTLTIRGGAPGTEVLIDQNTIGTVGADGTLSYNNVAPGDHVIDLRRDQFNPRRLQRSFRAGQPVVLMGADVVLAAMPTNGTIRVARTPPNATVTYKRADESEAHELRAPQVELPAGNYVFSAKAPGYTDRTERVTVVAGTPGTVDLTLARERVAAPVVKNGDIADFEEAGAWKKDGELWVHKGGGFVPYKLGPRGVYTFTVELLKGGGLFRGGRIRWCIQYVDAKNYQLFELDHKTFWAEVVEKGKKLERQKVQHEGGENQKAFTIQIEVTPDHVVHKLKTGDGWLTLDSFAEPGRNFTAGKFGFLIQGNDEIGISDFVFTPK